jgi:hypothetical protein
MAPNVFDKMAGIQFGLGGAKALPPDVTGGRVGFGTTLELANKLPENPGHWNDSVETVRKTAVNVATFNPVLTSGTLGLLVGGPVGAAVGAGAGLGIIGIDKATNGGATTLLQAGAKNFRSNYAFVRDVSEKNTGMGLLTGLTMLAGGAIGGVLGSALGPAGAIAGASLGVALLGKAQRDVAETEFGAQLSKTLNTSAKFSESEAGQVRYNLGRDVTRNVIAQIPGFKTMGDTSKGIGAVTSGFLNFGAELAFGADVAAAKLTGAAVRSAGVRPLAEPMTGFQRKIFGANEAQRVAKRLEEDVDLIKRTMAGEDTPYKAVFEFFQNSKGYEIGARKDFDSEIGQVSAHLFAGKSFEEIGNLLLVGRGYLPAIEELAQKHASTFAEFARYEDAIQSVSKGGIINFEYKGNLIPLSKRFTDNLDLVKAEAAALRKETQWLDDALQLDGAMKNRTVSRWAYIEKIRNDFAKETAARSVAGTSDFIPETGIGRAYQWAYQKNPLSPVIRGVDRITNDAPNGVVNYNEPVIANTRIAASLREAEKVGASVADNNVRVFDKWTTARTESEKNLVIEEYVATGFKLLANKHKIAPMIVDDAIESYITNHRLVQVEARRANSFKEGYMNDPQDPMTLISDPQLITQLANGSMLPDWTMVDKALGEFAKRNGQAATIGMQTKDAARLIADELNGLWRTGTLLRTGYPANVIKDSHIRAWGDAVLFDVWSKLGEDAIDAILNTSNTVTRANRWLGGKLDKNKNIAFLREEIDSRQVVLNSLGKQLKAAGYDPKNPPFEKAPFFPNLQDYKDGGSGGLPKTRSTVGFVKTSALEGMNGNTPGNLEAVASYRKSLRDGKGFAIREYNGKPYNDPIMVVYDDETGLAFVGEGNHRLKAAIDEGIPYVPVRVVKGYKSEMVVDVQKGRYPKQIKNNKKTKFVDSTSGKPVGEGYIPPEMHPSFIFDKDALVKSDDGSSAAKKVKESLLVDVEHYRTIESNIKMLRARENAAIQGIKPNRIRRQTVEVDGEVFEAAGAGRFGQLFMSKITQKDDLRRAMASVKELAIENARRSRTGSRAILPADEATHLLAWEQILNDKIRFDPVARMVLQGRSDATIVGFLKSNEGFSYMDRFAAKRSDAIEIYERVKTLVDMYAPTPQLKKLIIEDKLSILELKKLYPDVNQRPPVFGDMVDDMIGTSGFYTQGRQLTKDAVAWLSTMPTSKLAFNPYFRVKYEQELQSQIWVANSQNRVLTAKDKARFEQRAREFALREYREKLNSFHRNMNYAGWTNYLLAFFPAVVEQFRAYGRITMEHPDFLVKKLKFASLPEMISDVQEDSNGTQYFEVDLPYFGLKSRIPTSWFNPDNPTGGDIISFHPFAAASVNEFARRTNIENRFIDVVLPFGVQQNSLNALTPNTARRLSQVFSAGFSQSGEQFNKDVKMFIDTEMVQFIKDNNGRKPNAQEYSEIAVQAEKKSFYTSILRFLSASTLPVQGRLVTAVSGYVDILNKMQDAYGAEATEMFVEKYPEYFMLAERLTDPVSGIRPDKTAVSLIKRNKDSIRNIVSAIGEKGDLTTLGSIFNDEDYAFSSSAQAYLSRTKIPGTTKRFRDSADAFQQGRSALVSKGWNDFFKLQSIVEEQLKNAANPIDPTGKYGQAIVNKYVDGFVEAQKKDNPIWFTEYDKQAQGGAGSRQADTVIALTVAIEDDKLWNNLSKQPKWELILNYMQYRYDVSKRLEAMNTTIDAKKVSWLRDEVASTVAAMRAQNTEFAKFHDRYFKNDKFDFVYEGQE